LADRRRVAAAVAEARSPPMVAVAATAEARRRVRWRVRATMAARRIRWRVLAAAPAAEARRVLAAAPARLARLSPRRVSWSRRARRP
jgi:hypothetical protein